MKTGYITACEMAGFISFEHKLRKLMKKGKMAKAKWLLLQNPMRVYADNDIWRPLIEPEMQR